MTFNKFLILFTAFTLFLTACGNETETPNKNVNTNAAIPVNANANTNTNAAPSSNSPVATTTATPAQTTNSAETIKPVVMAYYQALTTKNDEALKKVYSRQTLQYLEGEAKAEGKKSLVEFVTDAEPPPAQPFEVRNEQQVSADVIIAEMRGGVFPNGINVKFVKENGEWKMTNENPEFPKK